MPSYSHSLKKKKKNGLFVKKTERFIVALEE